MGYEISGSPRRGLAGATLGFFIGFASVALFGTTAYKFQEAMRLSPVLIGLLVAIPALSGSLLRIPFAAWADTNGGRKPALVLLIMAALGMAGLLLLIYLLYPHNLSANLFPLLLVLGALCGCGIATFGVGVTQVSCWYPRRRQGSALGVYGGVANIAPGLFSLLLPLALASWGLAGSYLAWLVFLVLGTVAYFFIARNAWCFQLQDQGVHAEKAVRIAQSEYGQEVFPARSLAGSLAGSARVWKTWALVAIYFSTFGGFVALTAWLPTYWKDFLGVSPVMAGVLTASFSILASLARVAGGVVSDRLGGERTLTFALLAMLVGGALLTVSHGFGLSLFGELLLGAGMGVGNAAVFKLVPQEVPGAVGGASGWIGGIGAFGGFAIPPLMGAFARAWGVDGYALGFMLFIILPGSSLAFVYALVRARASSRVPQAAREALPAAEREAS